MSKRLTEYREQIDDCDVYYSTYGVFDEVIGYDSAIKILVMWQANIKSKDERIWMAVGGYMTIGEARNKVREIIKERREAINRSE